MNSMHSRNSWSFLSLALAASLGGCAYGYAEYDGDEMSQTYANTEESSAPPVLRYAIPADAPKGEAYVMSLGVQSFTSERDGTPTQMLLLRIAVENKSAGPWALDPAEATLAFDASAPVRPTYAKGSQTAGPQTIAPGGRGELTLYFALPPGGQPREANLRWQVHRGPETTAFDSRFSLMTGSQSGQVYYQPVYDPALVYAYGPGWWWGPSWYGGLGWWGAPWWWGGWGWGPHHHGWYHRGWGHGGWGHGWNRGGGGYPGGGFRGQPMIRGGGGLQGQPMIRGGGGFGGGPVRGGGPIRGGGPMRGGGGRR